MRWVALAVCGVGAACAGADEQAKPVLDGPSEVVVRELGPVQGPVVRSEGEAISVHWRAEPAGVVVVEEGAVRAVGRGEAHLSTEVDGRSLSWRLVVDLPVALRFDHAPGVLPVGRSEQLELVVDGVRGPVTWRSSNPAVVSVSDEGRVVGHAPGVAYVSARIGNAEAMIELRVEGAVATTP